MKWKAEFLIGIEAIDRQHKQIFECLLAIENSINKRDSWHVLRFLVAQLAESMKAHFAIEEALLELIQYPDYASHCASHARLAEALDELADRVRENRSAADLVAFFENWFIGHVLSSDREYAAYARQRLAQGAPSLP